MDRKIDMTLAEYIGAVTRVALAMRLGNIAEHCHDKGEEPTTNADFIHLSAALAQTHSGQVVDGSSMPLLKQYLQNARIAADIPLNAWEMYCPVKFKEPTT